VSFDLRSPDNIYERDRRDKSDKGNSWSVSPVLGVANDLADVGALRQDDGTDGPEAVPGLLHEELVAAPGQTSMELVGDEGVSRPGGGQTLFRELGKGLAQTIDEGRAYGVVIDAWALALEAVPVITQEVHVPVVYGHRTLPRLDLPSVEGRSQN
jgi:hypothetical protein